MEENGSAENKLLELMKLDMNKQRERVREAEKEVTKARKVLGIEKSKLTNKQRGYNRYLSKPLIAKRTIKPKNKEQPAFHEPEEQQQHN